jgi:CTP:phosphocholine cytidylyltransferase-like protein
MNVGEKLKKLKNNTIIHIQSEEHLKIIAPFVFGINFNHYLPEVLNKNFCIKKENGCYYWSELNQSKREKLKIISSNDIMNPTIYELW